MVNRELVHWIKEFQVPSVKSERGFDNEGCGSYLCPADEDWHDPAYVSYSSFHVNI